MYTEIKMKLPDEFLLSSTTNLLVVANSYIYKLHVCCVADPGPLVAGRHNTEMRLSNRQIEIMAYFFTAWLPLCFQEEERDPSILAVWALVFYLSRFLQSLLLPLYSIGPNSNTSLAILTNPFALISYPL